MEANASPHTKNPSKIDSGAFVNVSRAPAGWQPNPARCRARLPSASTPVQGPLAGLRRASCASVGTRLIPCIGAPKAEGLPTHPPPGDTGWQPRSGGLCCRQPGRLEIPCKALRSQQAHIPEVAPRMRTNCVKPLDQLRSDRKRGSQPILALLVLSVHIQKTFRNAPPNPIVRASPLPRRGST